MKKSEIITALRMVKRRNSSGRKLIDGRHYYECVIDENGNFISDGMQSLRKSTTNFCVYVPQNIENADSTIISDFGQMYILTLSYRFVARALLTNYQKSGLVMLDTIYKQVKAQGTMLFGQSMFAEIETECKYSRRYFDSKLHKFFERETPQLKQRIIYDTAKEFDFVPGLDKSKVVNEYDVFQDVEDLLSAAHERIMILVRAGQIRNFSDFGLYKSAIYQAINREIVYSKTITAQMSDNVRIFDENGLEKVINAQYFDDHSKITVDAILQTLASVMKTISPRANTDKAILAYRKTLDGFTTREVGEMLSVDHKQVIRWIKLTENTLTSVEFMEKVGEMF